MNVQDLVKIVGERGLKLILRDGQPFVRGDPKQVSDPLKDALRRYRESLIAHLEAEAAENVEQPI